MLPQKILFFIFLILFISFSNSVKLGSFFHLSDFHYDPLYNASCTPKTYCRYDFNNRTQNGNFPIQQNTDYGQYGCDSPSTLVLSALKSMSQLNIKPDFIIYTGDFAAHSLNNTTLVMEAIQFIVQSINETFPGIPIIPSLGNNDNTFDYEIPNTQWLQSLSSIFGNWIPSYASQEFSQGGYLHVNIGNLKILSLNTLYYSSVDNLNQTDPGNQFQWMKDHLQSAFQNQMKVYIIGHIPPGSNVYDLQHLWVNQYVDTFSNIITQYASIIEGMLFGHTHRDEFKVFSLNNSQIIKAYVLTPSLSPITFTSPSYRTVFYNQDTYSIHDYDEYYVDLGFLQKNSSPIFNAEYDFNDAYQAMNVSADSLLQLFEQFQTNPLLFEEWMMRRTVLYDPTRYLYYCALNFLDTNQFNNCVNNSQVQIKNKLKP